MPKPPIVFAALLFVFALPHLFPQETTPALDRLRWFLGTWKRESSQSITIEKWVRLSPKTFEGQSFRISKATGDTTFAESLRLVEMAGETFYIAKVAENKYPVPFKMVSIDEHKAVFENPGHDFPQRIVYVRNANGSLTVAVEAITGDVKRLEFYFQKAEE